VTTILSKDKANVCDAPTSVWCDSVLEIRGHLWISSGGEVVRPVRSDWDSGEFAFTADVTGLQTFPDCAGRLGELEGAVGVLLHDTPNKHRDCEK
jgi:hypothetical protein